MSKKHPEKYGKRFPAMPIPGVLVTATWANTEGKNKKFEDDIEAQVFFREMVEIKKKINSKKSLLLKVARKLAELLMSPPVHECSHTKTLPLSRMHKMLSFAERVQANPYLSCVNVCPATLPKNFASWALELADEASSRGEKHLWPDIEIVPFGGKNSMMRKENCPAPSALAHRQMGLLNLWYVHYDSVVNGKNTEKYRMMASKNCGKVAAGTNKFMGGDRRWNMFPRQILNDDGTFDEESLDSNWKHYFDDELSYRRTLKLKRTIDPNDVFTPNLFSVGASRKYGTAKEGDISLLPVDEILPTKTPTCWSRNMNVVDLTALENNNNNNNNNNKLVGGHLERVK